MSRTVAPFGSWVSALSTEDAAAGSVRFDGVSLSEVAEGGVRVRWLETRPDEAGRGVVCEWVGSVRSGGSAVDLLPAGVSARSLINEYGGGAWWDGPGDTVLAVDARSQDVVEIEAGVEPVVVVAGAGVRHAAGVLTPDGRWLVAEREHHPAPADGFHHDLVAVRLDGGASTPIELVRGPGFVAAPTVSPDGAHLAWLSWDHPDMPWDAAALWAGDLVERSGALAVERTRRVAGGADAGLNRAVSVCLPRWSADSLLWCATTEMTSGTSGDRRDRDSPRPDPGTRHRWCGIGPRRLVNLGGSPAGAATDGPATAGWSQRRPPVAGPRRGSPSRAVCPSRFPDRSSPRSNASTSMVSTWR
ncbi:MAG: hypothetical protein ACKO5A_10640 [Actinomycetota bacterium]